MGVKFAIAFGILSVLIIIASVEVSSRNFNLPIFIQRDSGIEKMSSFNVAELIYENNFSIERKTGVMPMDICSLRASGGIANLNGSIYDRRNKLSFNFNSFGKGDGSLTAQDGRERLSISFKINNIINRTSEILLFEANGNARANNENADLDNLDLIFMLNKTSNKISVIESKNLISNFSNNFSIKDMKVRFMEGCLEETGNYVFIYNFTKREEERSVSEVREILKENKEFLDAYEGLRRL